jgi:hypothetical protein
MALMLAKLYTALREADFATSAGRWMPGTAVNFTSSQVAATSGVPKSEDRVSSTSVARHWARAFREGAETFDLSFGSPPAWQSALREYQERKPRRPPSKAIAIDESTDGPAILRRVFSEPIEPDENDLGPDLTVSPPR